MRKMVGIIWKIYVVVCVTIVSSYAFLMVILLISIRFDSVELPNGSYLSHRRFLSFSQDDVVLRHANESILVNESIDLVCFDDRFVEGFVEGFGFYKLKSEFSNYSMRSFIYQEGQEEAIYDDDPRYAAVVNRAALRKAEGKCGIEGSWKNFHVLLRDRKYRR